jgi:IS1 family transposase
MPRKSTRGRVCPNADCRFHAQREAGNIVLHSFFRLKRGRRRRYRCTASGRTFCATTGTPYHRIQYGKNLFDEVAAMSVEGVSKSSIARIKGLSWNTVARWLERAAIAARRFNHAMTRDYVLRELQADEIRTFTISKEFPTWIFMTIEVASRLWPSTIVGRRSYRNTRRLLRETVRNGKWERPPLISTDGFDFYGKVIPRLFKHACAYGQVQKTWRNNRVIRVERTAVVGDRWQIEDALLDAEDSSTLNTSFIERLNLTVRQGSAYLRRRTPCHARSAEHLDNHLELLRCYYNFARPHQALKFGEEIRTPAMQANLTSKRLSFRDIFMSAASFFTSTLVAVRILEGHWSRSRWRSAA